MILNTDSLQNLEIRARDGVLGRVKDYYFDDESWTLRYLVVETGTWLNSRRVLLATSILDAVDWRRAEVPVDLTQEQVRRSPGLDTEKSVTRAQEGELQAHYGWPAYWTGAGDLGGGLASPFPVVEAPIIPPVPATAEAALTPALATRSAPDGDPRLRRGRAVQGYHIEASDGAIGHLESFLFEDLTWRLCYAVVDTRNWLPGRKVVIPPDWISSVSWSTARVYFDLTRDAIKSAPPYDPSTEFSPSFERDLHRHLGARDSSGRR
jgi:hypothetical protein